LDEIFVGLFQLVDRAKPLGSAGIPDQPPPLVVLGTDEGCLKQRHHAPDLGFEGGRTGKRERGKSKKTKK
jgi:hypothetical protein